MPIYVQAAEYLTDYLIRVTFTDGTIKDVDLSTEVEKGPVYEPWKDVNYFRQFYFNPESETIEWPNGADIAPSFLYQKGQPVELKQSA